MWTNSKGVHLRTPELEEAIMNTEKESTTNTKNLCYRKYFHGKLLHPYHFQLSLVQIVNKEEMQLREVKVFVSFGHYTNIHKMSIFLQRIFYYGVNYMSSDKNSFE